MDTKKILELVGGIVVVLLAFVGLIFLLAVIYTVFDNVVNMPTCPCVTVTK